MRHSDPLAFEIKLAIYALIALLLSCSKSDKEMEGNGLSYLSIIEISPADSATTADTITLKWTTLESITDATAFIIEDDYVPIYKEDIQGNISGQRTSRFMLDRKGWHNLSFTLEGGNGPLETIETNYYIRFENEMNWEAAALKLETLSENTLTYQDTAPYIYITPQNLTQHIRLSYKAGDYPIDKIWINENNIPLSSDSSHTIIINGTDSEKFYQIKSTDTRGKTVTKSFFTITTTPQIYKDTVYITNNSGLISIAPFKLPSQRTSTAGYIEVTVSNKVSVRPVSFNDSESNENRFRLSITDNLSPSFFEKPNEPVLEEAVFDKSKIVTIIQNNQIPAAYLKLLSSTDSTASIEINEYRSQ